jgi:serine/threonine-protein kinase
VDTFRKPRTGTARLPDATVTSAPLALEATVASTHGMPSGVVATAQPAGRTTVLPRIEIVDARPQVVADARQRFELVRRLGEGGQGEVVGVRDQDIGRNVALKRLRQEVKSTEAELRFAEEVRTVGQLEHPNIVPIHDVGVDEKGEYYLVMKYVEGETLEAIIDRLAAGDPETHARHGFERRVQIFVAILEAVAFAHTKGIIHRDIKPANVMIGPHGEVVLMDWGVALRRNEAGSILHRDSEIIGTPAYMSPEQARGQGVDERSDVYALSVLFHELLTLSHPLSGKTTVADVLHAVQHEKVPHAALMTNPHQPPVPAELAWFVQKGVAKDPAERYQSVGEMLDRLARRAEGSFPIQCPITFTKRVLGTVRRFVDHHPLLTVAALVVFPLGIVGLAAALLLR